MEFPFRGMAAEVILSALDEYEVDDAPFNRVWAITHRLHDTVREASVQFKEMLGFWSEPGQWQPVEPLDEKCVLETD